jgi:hypothetical protein
LKVVRSVGPDELNEVPVDFLTSTGSRQRGAYRWIVSRVTRVGSTTELAGGRLGGGKEGKHGSATLARKGDKLTSG